MLQSFRKLISKTPDLNEVQQNVFDTVQSLQTTPLWSRFQFETKDGLADNVEVSLGTFQLDPGEYSLFIQSGIQCTFPSVPSSIRGFLMLEEVSSGQEVVDSFSIGVDVNIGRGIYLREFLLSTKGQTYELIGKIATNGTITSRNLVNPSVTAFRRFL